LRCLAVSAFLLAALIACDSGGGEGRAGGNPSTGGSATSGGDGSNTGGAVASGGTATSRGGATNGGATNSGATNGGATNGGATNGGATSSSGGVSSGGASSTAACDAPNLVWKTARKTNYTSYPDPGSAECIEYNGCTWAGQFAACDGKKPEAWVAARSIAAAFPDFNTLSLHDLCLRKGIKTLVVTVLDTCADSDCDGCCTENQGSADQLIDLESYTNERWGVPDGQIEWADLGPTTGSGCDG
jgi:hypothetical protein